MMRNPPTKEKQNYNETNARKYKVDTDNCYKLGQPNGVARR